MAIYKTGIVYFTYGEKQVGVYLLNNMNPEEVGLTVFEFVEKLKDQLLWEGVVLSERRSSPSEARLSKRSEALRAKSRRALYTADDTPEYTTPEGSKKVFLIVKENRI